jgi:hypothetical protein
MVFLVVPGLNFDFASFSFHVPISGFAAKQTVVARRETARINPGVLVFMSAIESTISFGVNTFFDINPATRKSSGQVCRSDSHRP